MGGIADMSEVPGWLLPFASVGVIMMLYSIARAVESLVKVVNHQNVILNQIRMAISKREDD